MTFAPAIGEMILAPTDAASWPEVRILAIDIGARGAGALLDEAGELLDLVDLPTIGTGPARRPEISPHLLAGTSAELFARACDHDRAEAALLGLAALQREAFGRNTLHPHSPLKPETMP